MNKNQSSESIVNINGINNNINFKPRIAIISAIKPISQSENKGEEFPWDVYEAIYPLSLSNWNHYARKHGYALHFMNSDLYDNRKAAYWVKMSLIKYYFNVGYDYIFYTDLDWLFVDFNTTIEDIIASQPDKHIYLPYECLMIENRTKLMSGTFILKNSLISLSFINEWESLYKLYYKWLQPEQTALEHMMSSREINSSIGMTNNTINEILSKITTKYNVSNKKVNAIRYKIQNWIYWKKYVAILSPHQFMTYDTCIFTNMNEYGCENKTIKDGIFAICRGNMYGIHFPGRNKSTRMKRFYYPIKLKYDISFDSIQFKSINESDMFINNNDI